MYVCPGGGGGLVDVRSKWHVAFSVTTHQAGLCRKEGVFPRNRLLQPASLQVPELEGAFRPPASCEDGGPACAINADVEAITSEVRAVDRTDRMLGGDGCVCVGVGGDRIAVY